MSEFNSPDIQAINAEIESLIAQGGNRFDPVRFRYIESMAKRCYEQREGVAAVLKKKVLNTLVDYQKDYEHAKLEAERIVKQLCELEPNVAQEVQQLLENHAYKAIKRFAAKIQENQQSSLLSDLTHRVKYKGNDSMESEESFSFDDMLRAQEEDALQSYAKSVLPGIAKGKVERGGLKSFRMYRDSWLKQNATKILQQAINSAPANPGPLNPEMLTIRSLIAMRDLSPEYTTRLIGYIDTLLWLEEAANSMDGSTSKHAKGKAKVRKKKR